MEEQEITREEWDLAGEDQWRDIVNAEWAKEHISLSAAVYWIATRGEARDCDYDALESAAKLLLRQARSKEAPLKVKGRKTQISSRRDVERDDLADAMPFFGMDDALFESGAPYLQWNSMLEPDRRDTVEKRDGSVSWHELAIEHEDMLRFWPAAKDGTSEPAADPVTQVAVTATDEPARMGAIAHEHSADMAPAHEVEVEAPSVANVDSVSATPATVGSAAQSDATSCGRINLPDAIAQRLRAMYPTRPSMKRKSLMRIVKNECSDIGEFSMTVFAAALKKAYG